MFEWVGNAEVVFGLSDKSKNRAKLFCFQKDFFLGCAAQPYFILNF